MKYFVSTIFLFVLAAVDVNAQGVQVLRAFNSAVGTSGVRITQSTAARALITQATAANVAGVTLAALKSTGDFETAVSKILAGSDTALKAKATNFLEAVSSATARITAGESARTVIAGLTAQSLSSAAGVASAQVKGAKTRAAKTEKELLNERLKQVDEFEKVVIQRANTENDPTLKTKIREAASELKEALRNKVVVLGSGAASCVTGWPTENHPQVVKLVEILAHVDNAKTNQQAYDNLKSGAAKELGVDPKEAARRIDVLSDPKNCRALSPQMAAAA